MTAGKPTTTYIVKGYVCAPIYSIIIDKLQTIHGIRKFDRKALLPVYGCPYHNNMIFTLDPILCQCGVDTPTFVEVGSFYKSGAIGALRWLFQQKVAGHCVFSADLIPEQVSGIEVVDRVARLLYRAVQILIVVVENNVVVTLVGILIRKYELPVVHFGRPVVENR
jgi:hypothetical protein